MLILHSTLFLRTLRKEGEIYVLKIATLSIGFACAIVIILFCWNEYHYDGFHSDADHVFRAVQKQEAFEYEGNRYSDRIAPEFFNRLTKQKFITIARCKVMQSQTLQVGNKLFAETTLHEADSSITSIFSFVFISGSPARFNTTNGTALLSASLAQTLFGTENAAKKKFSIVSGSTPIIVEVAGVFKDFAKNTHEEFNVFIRYSPADIVKLNMDPDDFGVYGRATNSQPADRIETNFKSTQLKQPGSPSLQNTSLIIQPITQIHFGRRVLGESAHHGDPYSIFILICIASLIFLLALTNHINLTTLTLPNRAKELAIKKVAGAGRRVLLLGFAFESLLVVCAALVIALLILICVKGLLRSSLPVDPGILIEEKAVFAISAVGMLGVTCIGPLLVSIKFIRAAPTRLLGTDTITFPRFKKIITVFQLGICLSLLVSAMVVRKQIVYSLVKEPGRNKDQVVYLPFPHNMTLNQLHKLENEWAPNNQADAHMEGVTAVSHLPNQVTRKEVGMEMYSVVCDRNFPEFFRYRMNAGRWFSNSDSTGVVLNKLAASQQSARIGLLQPRDAVLGVIDNLGGIYNQSEKPTELSLGLATDFNFLCIRIIEVDVRKTVAFLAGRFDLPHGVADVKFLDKKFEDWLSYEDKLGSLCGLLAIISGAMALCAIYGLSLSLGNDRIRQVAIHKMLGASLPDVVRILMRSFAIPMLIAALAFGLATYIFLKEWLRNFIYQAHFGFWEGLAALTFCTLIIALTCSRQAIKLSDKNLVGHLK